MIISDKALDFLAWYLNGQDSTYSGHNFAVCETLEEFLKGYLSAPLFYNRVYYL